MEMNVRAFTELLAGRGMAGATPTLAEGNTWRKSS